MLAPALTSSAAALATHNDRLTLDCRPRRAVSLMLPQPDRAECYRSGRRRREIDFQQQWVRKSGPRYGGDMRAQLDLEALLS